MLAGSMFFGTVAILMFFLFLYVRSEYREFDRRETLKEGILEERAKVKKLQDHFRETYEANVYSSIKVSLDFCIRLIYNKSPEEQLEGLKNLYEVLYETDYRLRKDYADVNYILAPLVNLRTKLFEEQMDFIKENFPEEVCDLSRA